jgi:PAS domain S-box-containing protein
MTDITHPVCMDKDYECEMLRKILSLIPVGIYYVHERELIWVNKFMETIMGYSLEEVAGKNVRKFYESEEEYIRVGKLLYNEKSGVVTNIVRKDGSKIMVMMHSLSEEKRDKGEFLFPHVILVSVLSGFLTEIIEKSHNGNGGDRGEV